MTTAAIIWTVVKILIMVGFVLNLAGILTWADRRQSAMIQHRIGPNRAVVKVFGKEIRVLGLLHTAADGIKFFTKEDFMPPRADRVLFALAPIIALGAVFALLGAIPFGDTICPHHFVVNWPNIFAGPAVPRSGVCSIAPGSVSSAVDLTVAPLSVGILYIFAIAGQGIIGAAIAGWSSDNKFSLMGALRAASQMVSYEVTLGMSLIGAMMIYGTVRLDDMVRWQIENTWGIFVQPLAFFLFFAASVAENKRIPFDLPEAESELVSGYFTEYAGMKFGMFYFAEYAEVVTGSMLLVTIFLGGWGLPFFHRDGLTLQFGDWTIVHAPVAHFWMTLLGVVAFFGKVIAVCWVQTFVRWTLPRFRYDQLMKLGWKILLPLSLGNIFVTGVVWLALDKAGPAVSNSLRVAADVAQGVVALAMLYLVARGVLGIFAPIKHEQTLLGSSVDEALKHGGTKTGPMQA
ncbi:MAG TPA: complex I subunit 1 family protein [Polyangiaceae bacterium]|jgi:NADH-quinone oxidoreductase subunit H|nr:complex I subunit 1 family protein [Polyangiaceae bacterium]